jgi:hypothetical protein
MIVVPETATDADIIAAVDSWVSLLESENYVAACESVDSPPGGVWTPELIRGCIKDHWDDAPKDHRVTLEGTARQSTIDGRKFVKRQLKEVDRSEPNEGGELHEIWYDLNVDGVVSDLTATFRLVRVPQGLLLRLYDICVR